MSIIEPAGERAVRHLREAVERLQEDIVRVELWAGAVGCFVKPIPDYDPAQSNLNKYILPAASAESKRNGKQRGDAANKTGPDKMESGSKNGIDCRLLRRAESESAARPF